MKKLYTEERRAEILKQLKLDSRASVSDLAAKLNVSEVTIRADLRALEKSNLLLRTHGGAIMPEDEALSFTTRLNTRRSEKTRIAAEAFKHIKNHDSILLDASSTCLELAKLLRYEDINVTVTTYSLFAAQELVDNPKLNVFLIGGALRNQNSVEGLLGVSILDNIYPEKYFFSARGVTEEGELMDFDLYELELKNFLFNRSKYRYCLLDSSKIFSSSVGRFGSLKESEYLFTDTDAPKDLEQRFPELKIEYC
ncbi:DeoR/GlpR family DNA-binding transcription regulator [Alicyclobacillus dauci]|uniref:DeoR/GlpR family DNA-binding transcription regulator n=1 Tax=Alicyclobacillus dauci TaxID=1475485 RepID=A0ABY6Z7K5_9BACL|nr:DeoR/GlpR family DNA-binding transcription regulator [Alicyclobacillus dauci]WAH38866.1 DeoR/GlpR family DNA-binding transcription regulator [Alicyclobacillus dauci]